MKKLGIIIAILGIFIGIGAVQAQGFECNGDFCAVNIGDIVAYEVSQTGPRSITLTIGNYICEGNSEVTILAQKQKKNGDWRNPARMPVRFASGADSMSITIPNLTKGRSYRFVGLPNVNGQSISVKCENGTFWPYESTESRSWAATRLTTRKSYLFEVTLCKKWNSEACRASTGRGRG